MRRVFAMLLSLIPLTAAAQAPGSSFVYGLFRDIAAGDKSNIVFVSPMSASLALSMTAAGADGRTQEEMIGALGFEGMTIKEINGYNHSLMQIFSRDPEGVVLNVANSIWVSDELPLKRRFVKTVEKQYSARVSNLDFASPASVSVINGWCSDNTAGRIDKIIERIDPGMMMYLINALYFKGLWQVPFAPERSGEDIFHGDAADSEVKFMHNTHEFMHYVGPEASLLEMPYGDGSFVMDVFLPGEGVPVDEFVTGLDDEAVTVLTGLMRPGRVKVSLPVFKAEYETSLNEVLQQLGIVNAFTAMADFSGMSKEPLMISDVRQKTFVEVNEKGSEAAAVTSVSVMRASAVAPEDYVVFDVDRPFVFLIRERTTGTVLFLGMVRNL